MFRNFAKFGTSRRRESNLAKFPNIMGNRYDNNIIHNASRKILRVEHKLSSLFHLGHLFVHSAPKYTIEYVITTYNAYLTAITYGGPQWSRQIPNI